jgi:hypothetical protein
MSRISLYRSYGMTLERILDVNQIKGSRSVAKHLLHKALKRAKGIKTLTSLTDYELEQYIEEINNFFPIEHDNRI